MTLMVESHGDDFWTNTYQGLQDGRVRCDRNCITTGYPVTRGQCWTSSRCCCVPVQRAVRYVSEGITNCTLKTHVVLPSWRPRRCAACGSRGKLLAKDPCRWTSALPMQAGGLCARGPGHRANWAQARCRGDVLLLQQGGAIARSTAGAGSRHRRRRRSSH